MYQKSSALKNLLAHHQSIKEIQMRDLFTQDPNRFSEFSLEVAGILFDYSKQRILEETLHQWNQYAIEVNLFEKIDALLSGKIVNSSEQRPALHTALRDPTSNPILVEGLDIKPKIHQVLSRMEKLVNALQEETSPIRDIISLGIGGSDLGPSMVCEALHSYKISPIQFHFISNVDGKSLASVLKKCNPKTTLCIINSKTFTTPETLKNAEIIKKWLSEHLSSEKALSQLIGVTANPKQALNFGILEDNIFEFWDFVGGRYSVWSAVGLPIAIALGMANFKEFLAGAHAIDKHFSKADFRQNMPVLMAMISNWNINFWNFNSQAIIPYDDGLRKFPDYLQQLEMESNGKSANKEADFVSYSTSPIIWGGVGCNSQHAYMQLLHQGTQIVPIDFLIAAKGQAAFEECHHLLLASCFSQSKALMEGDNSGSIATRCLGNRPSNTFIYPQLTPFTLGALIALYEHKVFVQGVFWGINSFDQFGVELGKKLVKKLLPLVENPEQSLALALDNPSVKDLDSSTRGLIQFLLSQNINH